MAWRDTGTKVLFQQHVPLCVPSLLPPGTPLTREQCQVPAGRVPCVAPEGQGRDGCLEAGCCYDDMDRTTPCYYGNTGRNIPKSPPGAARGRPGVTEPLGGVAATVQCLLEGHFVLVVPRGMVNPPYNLDSVRLASSQEGCEPLRVSEAFVMFRFPVTHCGTTVQVGPGETPRWAWRGHFRRGEHLRVLPVLHFPLQNSRTLPPASNPDPCIPQDVPHFPVPCTGDGGQADL